MSQFARDTGYFAAGAIFMKLMLDNAWLAQNWIWIWLAGIAAVAAIKAVVDAIRGRLGH